ncbi:HD-GYP domain-containing protein [Mariprofundus erugo]|uniref:HD-GYP domain-containing protein n=1 Tax=Mariprofundus erugo TaxID=2528639 RepID=UPI001386972D|nr:HD-GYP domain-containing protein [Mariprofundus erugo]
MNVVANWQDRRLTSVLDAAHRRSRRRIMLLTIVAALMSGAGVFAYSSTFEAEHITGTFKVVAVATIISLLTATVLYPALKIQNQWLFQATSTMVYNNIDLLLVLGKLTELRDGETASHNLRVTVYTVWIAEIIGFSPAEIVRAAKGALLHDVGKLVVPDHILHKPGPLNPNERVEMNRHVQHGMDIISQSHSLLEAKPLVAAHHEHFDGTGYPFGLKAEAIPPEARLFALVDVFDALTSARVYKPAYSIDDALATMSNGRGSHFDPVMFDHFKRLAPTIVAQMPKNEADLTQLLMDRLSPYLDDVAYLGPGLTDR